MGETQPPKAPKGPQLTTAAAGDGPQAPPRLAAAPVQLWILFDSGLNGMTYIQMRVLKEDTMFDLYSLSSQFSR